jgi:hypothetical protein
MSTMINSEEYTDKQLRRAFKFKLIQSDWKNNESQVFKLGLERGASGVRVTCITDIRPCLVLLL